MIHKFLKLILLIINHVWYRPVFINPEKLPTKGPAIIAANHQHAFDIFLIHSKTKPWIHWVAKKQLCEIPIIGKMLLGIGVIPVDRDKKDTNAARMMFENVKKGNVIGIFPQATRMKNPDMINKVIPKTGTVHIALKTGIPIIPVGLKGDFKPFSKIFIIAGDPVDFTGIGDGLSSEDKLMAQTIHVMRTIYSLIGYDYLPNDNHSHTTDETS